MLSVSKQCARRSQSRMAPSSSSSNSRPSAVMLRTHMNHRGDQMQHHPIDTGPRHPLTLGMDSARASQNILRLLESSHGTGTGCADTFSSVWHPQGQICRMDQHWHVMSAQDELQALREGQSRIRPIQAPSLASLELSDDRTALAKIVGTDGLSRYISLLKLDAEPGAASGIVANDGWHILREVVGGKVQGSIRVEEFSTLSQTLSDYLSVEHGGGPADKQRATDLFAPQSSLTTVGAADPDDPPSEWSAPAGTFLEISLECYLRGVESQTPHGSESQTQDAIVSMDILPCQTAAAATVHVGNGACTNVFVDHLLLGKTNNHDDEWCILSKTFAARHWPSRK
jgi:hypothetical protein